MRRSGFGQLCPTPCRFDPVHAGGGGAEAGGGGAGAGGGGADAGGGGAALGRQVLPPQIPLWQSLLTTHPWPSPHCRSDVQLPPQSLPVSSPSWIPSTQVAGGD